MLTWCSDIYWFLVALPGCAWRAAKRSLGEWIDSVMR